MNPADYEAGMIERAAEHAAAFREAGRPIVGIMCEYTPRELILAAGAVPVCLCGGSQEMVAVGEQELPNNLCPLIKSTYGFHRSGENLFLEGAALVVAETTCDGKKKMFELLGRTRPVHVLTLPHRPDDPAAFELWVGELARLRTELETRFSVTVTDDRLRDAVRLMNRERRVRRGLAALLRRDAPPLTGRELLGLKSILGGIEAELELLEGVLAGLTTAPGRPELRDRVRVLLTGVPLVHGAERVLELIEGNGGLVVAQENCTGLKPLLADVPEDAPDPLRALARHYSELPCSVMTPNRRRFDRLRELARDYRPAAVVELVWQACLTYDVESRLVKELAAAELQLPYLKIETDYSPADSERIAVRFKALAELARARAGR